MYQNIHLNKKHMKHIKTFENFLNEALIKKEGDGEISVKTSDVGKLE